MSKPMIRIHDTSTDKIIDREMNDEEFAIYTAEQELFAAQENAKTQAAAAKAVAKAKLAELGLTTDDLKALGL